MTREETIEKYQKMSKRERLEAVEKRHEDILKQIKSLRCGAKIESFTYFKNELYQQPYHYVFEICITGADKKFASVFRQVAKEKKCPIKKIQGKNMYVIFTSKIAEYKHKN